MEDEVFGWLPGRRTQLMQWLPSIVDFPGNVRVVLSALPGPSLDSLRSGRHCSFLRVSPLSPTDQLALIHTTLSNNSKALRDDLASEIAKNTLSQNPLFLTLLLEELIQYVANVLVAILFVFLSIMIPETLPEILHNFFIHAIDASAHVRYAHLCAGTDSYNTHAHLRALTRTNTLIDIHTHGRISARAHTGTHAHEHTYRYLHLHSTHPTNRY